MLLFMVLGCGSNPESTEPVTPAAEAPPVLPMTGEVVKPVEKIEEWPLPTQYREYLEDHDAVLKISAMPTWEHCTQEYLPELEARRASAVAYAHTFKNLQVVTIGMMHVDAVNEPSKEDLIQIGMSRTGVKEMLKSVPTLAGAPATIFILETKPGIEDTILHKQYYAAHLQKEYPQTPLIIGEEECLYDQALAIEHVLAPYATQYSEPIASKDEASIYGQTAFVQSAEVRNEVTLIRALEALKASGQNVDETTVIVTIQGGMHLKGMERLRKTYHYGYVGIDVSKQK